MCTRLYGRSFICGLFLWSCEWENWGRLLWWQCWLWFVDWAQEGRMCWWPRRCRPLGWYWINVQELKWYINVSVTFLRQRCKGTFARIWLGTRWSCDDSPRFLCPDYKCDTYYITCSLYNSFYRARSFYLSANWTIAIQKKLSVKIDHKTHFGPLQYIYGARGHTVDDKNPPIRTEPSTPFTPTKHV